MPRASSRAAEKLVEAGRLLAREPQAMQLRYFAALHDIASERVLDHRLSSADRSAHPSRPTTGRSDVTLIRGDFVAGFTMGAIE